jgi:hypothetical protein
VIVSVCRLSVGVIASSTKQFFQLRKKENEIVPQLNSAKEFLHNIESISNNGRLLNKMEQKVKTSDKRRVLRDDMSTIFGKEGDEFAVLLEKIVKEAGIRKL